MRRRRDVFRRQLLKRKIDLRLRLLFRRTNYFANLNWRRRLRPAETTRSVVIAGTTGYRWAHTVTAPCGRVSLGLTNCCGVPTQIQGTTHRIDVTYVGADRLLSRGRCRRVEKKSGSGGGACFTLASPRQTTTSPRLAGSRKITIVKILGREVVDSMQSTRDGCCGGVGI